MDIFSRFFNGYFETLGKNHNASIAKNKLKNVIVVLLGIVVYVEYSGHLTGILRG